MRSNLEGVTKEQETYKKKTEKFNRSGYQDRQKSSVETEDIKRRRTKGEGWREGDLPIAMEGGYSPYREGEERHHHGDGGASFCSPYPANSTQKWISANSEEVFPFLYIFSFFFFYFLCVCVCTIF